MANFDRQTLADLKKLCKIECSPEENEDVLSSLGKILDYVEQLKEIDTDNVKTCRYILRGMGKNRLRKDLEADPLSREEFLAGAPDQIGGMVRVPPVPALKPSP